jgi:hypothetical protein
MMRVLLWKEYREHRAIWLSLAIVGVGGLYTLSRLIPDVWGLNYSATRDSLQAVAVMLAWTYGLVCGAMLLANEAETGALTFLEQLPLRRARLWWSKTLFGLVLFALQLVLLSVFVVVLGVAETPRQLGQIVLAMTFFGLFSLSWGLLFSARGENVLNVIGLSILGQLFGAAALALLFAALAAATLLLLGREVTLLNSALLCLAALAAVALPTIGSFRLYTRLDRQRLERVEGQQAAISGLPFWVSWQRLLWMSYVRLRRMLVGLSIFALIFGLLLPLIGPLAWPALTLLIGVLCGITVWGDEQFSASYRFLGDQRFPLGRIWFVKIATRFCLAVFISIVLLVPSLVLALIHRYSEPSGASRSFLIDLLHCEFVGTIVPLWAYLFLWLLYGFSTGQLAGLLFRKSIVAGFVALGTAGLLVALWTPSLLGMGLHFWQVAGAPAAMLAASRLLMPAWTAERLLTRGAFVRLGCALLAAGLWTAGSIWYRVLEIPYLPEPFDVPAFAATIPSLAQESNPAGMEIRGVWKHVELMANELYVERRGDPLFDDLRRDGGERDTFSRQIEAVTERGWPNRSSELGLWLNKQFQEEWYRQLATAARQPVGTVEDTKILTVTTRFGHLWVAVNDLNRILAARGLQRQAEGDPCAFVENLRIGLALSRNLRNRTPPLLAQIGLGAEIGILESALDPWLERLPNDVQTLELLRDVLVDHERQRPSIEEAVKAQYLLAWNSLESEPAKLIESELRQVAQWPRERQELLEAECEAVALFWRIPWERERHERILRVAFRDDPREHRRIVQWSGTALGNLIWQTRGQLRDRQSLVVLHAALLKTAVRLYQAKNQGRLPAQVADLAPDCLPVIPMDPFDGQPFRFRVSKGEELIWPDESLPNWPRLKPLAPRPGGNRVQNAEEPTRTVPFGRVILWSVGEDGRDGGGTRQTTRASAGDLIYLVPPPASE